MDEILKRLDRTPRSVDNPEPATAETFRPYAERLGVALKSSAVVIATCPSPRHLFPAISDALEVVALALVESQDLHRQALVQASGANFASQYAQATNEAMAQIREGAERLGRMIAQQNRILEAAPNGTAAHGHAESAEASQ